MRTARDPSVMDHLRFARGDALLRMTMQLRSRKTGSRSSPSEANRGDVQLHRMSQREKSCLDGQEDLA
jgi:hypothetical protein